MMMKRICHTSVGGITRQSGFTLLEIIVTLILIGVTGALIYPVMHTNLSKSVVPVRRLSSHHLLIREMDRLTGRYRQEIKNDSLDIHTFKTTYVDENAYIDAAGTGFLGVGQITGNAYSTQSPNILRVTLADGDQKIVSFFTE